jgi:hypothetical protein
MLDVNGGAIKTVAVGDKLTHVDGRSTHVDGLHIREDMILGEENTCVELRLVSGTTGKEYSVVARRHVFVRKREQVTKRFEVRPDLLRQDLTVEPKLVQTLDNVRRMIADPAGNLIDLLDGVGSLGLRVGKEIPDKALPPLQITEMSPCGPAALSRQIDRGDEIVRSLSLDFSSFNTTQGEVCKLKNIGINLSLVLPCRWAWTMLQPTRPTLSACFMAVTATCGIRWVPASNCNYGAMARLLKSIYIVQLETNLQP